MDGERNFLFLIGKNLVYPGPHKQGLKMKKFVQPTPESEGIAHLMPEEKGKQSRSNDGNGSCQSESELEIEDEEDPDWNDF